MPAAARPLCEVRVMTASGLQAADESHCTRAMMLKGLPCILAPTQAKGGLQAGDHVLFHAAAAASPDADSGKAMACNS